MMELILWKVLGIVKNNYIDNAGDTGISIEKPEIYIE